MKLLWTLQTLTTTSDWEIIRSIGSGLVDYRPGATGPNDIIPDLATNWSVSSDGLQYTFSLRQGVKYDDGTEFNATHIKYTFDREMGIADPNGPFVGIGFTGALSLATGDLNLDGAVDISDAILAATAFGSCPGHPSWNGQADLNHDNEVDIFDIIILANNFGKLSSY